MSPLAAQTALILRNDLRLFWRELRAGRWRLLGNGALIVLALLALHALTFLLCFNAKAPPPLGVETLLWAFFGFTMLGAAMNHAISLLYERADFDLLLGAPIQPRAVLLARVASVGLTAAYGVAIFLLPLLNGAAFGLGPRYFAGYLVWFLLAALVAALGITLTLALVRWLGVRRARTAVQILAALLGGSVYLCSQLPNLLPVAKRQGVFLEIWQILQHPALALPGLAGRGDLRLLGALALITIAAVALTTRQLARVFVRGTQDATVVENRRPSSGRTHRWTEGLAAATFRKDLRLIVRDPLLLAQILPTAFYLLPAVVILSRGGNGGGFGMLAPLGVLIAAQFSGILTTVAAAGEECWDLIRMSPSPELRLRLAKMAAGMVLPVALATLLFMLVACLGRPWFALLGLSTSLVVAAAIAWLAVTDIRPSPRKDLLKKRRNSNIGHGILGSVLMLSAAGGIGLIGRDYALVGGILLGVAWLGSLACLVLLNLKPVDLKAASSVRPAASG